MSLSLIDAIAPNQRRCGRVMTASPRLGFRPYRRGAKDDATMWRSTRVIGATTTWAWSLVSFRRLGRVLVCGSLFTRPIAAVRKGVPRMFPVGSDAPRASLLPLLPRRGDGPLPQGQGEGLRKEIRVPHHRGAQARWREVAQEGRPVPASVREKREKGFDGSGLMQFDSCL